MELPDGIQFNPILMFVVTLVIMGVVDFLKEVKIKDKTALDLLGKIFVHPAKVISMVVSIAICIALSGLAPEKLCLFGIPWIDGAVAGLAMSLVASTSHDVVRKLRPDSPPNGG